MGLMIVFVLLQAVFISKHIDDGQAK